MSYIYEFVNLFVVVRLITSLHDYFVVLGF